MGRKLTVIGVVFIICQITATAGSLSNGSLAEQCAASGLSPVLFYLAQFIVGILGLAICVAGRIIKKKTGR